MSTERERIPVEVDPEAMLLRLVGQTEQDPDGETVLEAATEEFLREGWRAAESGLLSRTTRLRVEPLGGSIPRTFRFEIDVPYKRKPGPDAPVEPHDGPLGGTMHYGDDVLDGNVDPRIPAVLVLLTDRAFFHPNFSRRLSALCLGRVPRALPLTALLEHLYSIVTYQNLSTVDPLDREAARYFAQDPRAREGLDHPEPLY